MYWSWSLKVAFVAFGGQSDPNSMPKLTPLALSDQAYHIGSYSCEIKQIELTYYLKINLITLPPVNEQVITIQSLDKPTHLLLCNNLALIQGCLMCLQSRTTGRNVLKTGLKKSQFFPFGDILTNLYTTLTPLNWLAKLGDIQFGICHLPLELFY